MNNWLQDFEYHVTIGPWVFVSAALLIGIVTAVTVGYQSMQRCIDEPGEEFENRIIILLQFI